MSSVEIEEAPHHVLWRLSRPKVHNAVDESVISGLEAALGDLEQRDDRRPIVLTGAGETTFCAGGDLTWFATLDRTGAERMSRRIGGLLERLNAGPRVLIAAVNGDVWGGGAESSTACHLRVARRGARLSFRQARLGASTGWGGAGRLFRAIGRGRALELLLTAETLGMDRAREIGLVARVVEPGDEIPAAVALATRIGEMAPESIAGFLELARLDGEALRRREAELFLELWEGPTFRETISGWRGGT